MERYDPKTIPIYLISFILFTTFFYAPYIANAADSLSLDQGDEWRYYKGTEDLPRNWHSKDYDDSAWEKGPAGFGYGPGQHNTILNDMQGKYSSLYVRRDFTVDTYSKITKIALAIYCDGPFIAYLNNIEAIRSRRPQRGDPLDLTGFAHELEPGKNVISIKCNNDNILSDDYSFVPLFKFHEESEPGNDKGHNH